MRILQVLTLLSPDGAYGGVARVALNQSAELIRCGHDVTITAATVGDPDPPTTVDDVPAKLFPARMLVPGSGFAGLVAPSMMRWFLSHRRSFDVAHIHLARELVMVPMALAVRHYRLPFVVQAHGMIIPSHHPLSGPLDAMAVRPVLRSAGAVFFLTARERRQLLDVARAPLPLMQLDNGVPEYPPTAETAEPPEVLFAARLHPRKRPLDFVEMARTLLTAGVNARFTLIGPDEGEGAAVRAAIAYEPRISWTGPLAPHEMPARLADAAIYVLPSVQEPYPMSVLEAMSVGLPVVVTDDCGLAPFITRTKSGLVAEVGASPLVAAVDALLADPVEARAMGARGRTAVRTTHSMHGVVEQLVETYTSLTGGGR